MINGSTVEAIGYTAQGIFASRFLVQWLKSEKFGRVMVPLLFWQLSLVASFLLIAYSIMVKDLPILLGQVMGYYIYVRNLRFKKAWRVLPLWFRYLVIGVPVVSAMWLLFGGEYSLMGIMQHNTNMWLLFWGTAGQAVFAFRFVYQWIYSERVKRSVLPLGFWVISIIGALLICTYAWRMELYPIILGHLFGFVVYGRNIMLHYKYKNKVKELHANEDAAS